MSFIGRQRATHATSVWLMCGIVGLAYPQSRDVEPATLHRMCDVIVHRGPDDEGLHVDGNVGIGMRRLSIVDLASGHQPIHNEDSTVWVVLNGEIYNHPGLREMLAARGHRFYTKSDTEVLVHLYEEYGDALVDHLDGMFCFALWDTQRKRLLIARDRLGEKQLYYSWAAGKLAFGSEIKCLLQLDWVSRDVDAGALDAYLNFLYVPAPRTAYRDIQELPPACTLLFDQNGLRVQRYWSVDYSADTRRSEQELAADFRQRFFASVRARMVSDVPLGALLSGGIDSSAVVAAMSEVASGPVKTFCVGYDGDACYYDERRYAAVVARQFATEHHEFVVTPDVCGLIPTLIQAFDQPFADASALANYYVFRETRKHVTVVLSGVGGDEIGAGYERHLGISWHERYRRLPAWLRRGVVAPLVHALPDAAWGGRRVERARRFVRGAEVEAGEAYFRFNSTFATEQRAALYSPRFRAAVDCEAPRQVFAAAFAEPTGGDVLQRVLHVDTMTYLPGDLLTLTDRMSMLSSVEARAPFIDHRLVEFMAGVPSGMKLKGTSKKHLLKLAFQGLLPNEILYRRKQGFTLPLTLWFRSSLRAYVERSLSRARVDSLGMFDWPEVQRLLVEHMTGKDNHQGRLWALMMLLAWFEQYQPTLDV